MWLLVLISLMANNQGEIEPVIEGFYEYKSLSDCFWARETFATQLQKGDGKQAICIYKDLN